MNLKSIIDKESSLWLTDIRLIIPITHQAVSQQIEAKNSHRSRMPQVAAFRPCVTLVMMGQKYWGELFN
jgi:hypothetical protein